jgi:hypothetical protein
MPLAESELSLAPLGAGDLIDRAVRLYRRHFFTLIRIAAPPVLVSAAGTAIFTIAGREIGATNSSARLLLYVLMLFGGSIIVVCGLLFSLVVMGGATRNLVAHLLWDEAVSFRSTYRAVKSRFWGLLWGSILMGFWFGISAWISFILAYMAFAVILLAVIGFGRAMPPWVIAIFSGFGTVAALAAGLILFFLLAGRMAYVPQAMLVEGRGISSAIGRSFSLASGNIRRLMAMTLFTSFATYSALAILIIPLGWYGWLNGVDLSPFATWPAWYSVCYEVILQCSHILLAPIWMLGLSLLYVDERVRHEGYDIELMAARQLTEMPELPGVMSPFAPALVTRRTATFVAPPPAPMPPQTVLGLH